MSDGLILIRNNVVQIEYHPLKSDRKQKCQSKILSSVKTSIKEESKKHLRQIIGENICQNKSTLLEKKKEQSRSICTTWFQDLLETSVNQETMGLGIMTGK